MNFASLVLYCFVTPNCTSFNSKVQCTVLEASEVQHYITTMQKSMDMILIVNMFTLMWSLVAREFVEMSVCM